MSDQYTKRAMADAGDEFLEEEFDLDFDDLDPSSEAQQYGPEQADADASCPDEEAGDDVEPYPTWEGETLHVPPQWRGQLSEIEFASRLQPEGTMIIAEIPGETTSVITALCTDAEGLLDTCFGIDAAVSIASEPEGVPAEFLVEHALQLHVATVIFKEAARRMDESLDEAFCPPDKVTEFKAQKNANTQGAATLRATAKRVEDAIAAVSPPMLTAAVKRPMGMSRVH